jgi:polysaccharide biosynthesis transport protein
MNENTNNPFDSNSESKGGDSVDWKRILHIVQKYFWIVIITSIVGVSLAYVITKKQTPLYKTHTTIVISSQLPSYLGSQLKSNLADMSDDYWYEKRYLETQYEIIKSRKIALMVAKRMDRKYIFEILGTPHLAHREPTEKEVIVCSNIIRMLVMVIPMTESRIVRIGIINKNPKLAAYLANLVANTYIDENLERRLLSTRSASSWLGKQLKTLRDKLENSEKLLYEFKMNNNVMDISLEQRMISLSKIIHSRISLVENNDVVVRRLRSKLKQFRSLRRKDATSDAGADYLKSEIIINLRSKYYDSIKKLELLKVELLERNPKVLQQQKMVKLTKGQMKKELVILEKSLNAEYKSSLTNLSESKVRLDTSRMNALALGKLNIGYKKLKRERDETTKLYELVLSRLKETGLVEELKTNNIRLLDLALEPRIPFKPVLIINLAMGLALGLFIGIGFMILFFYLDNTMKSSEEIEQYLKASFLGYVPLMSPHKLNTPEFDLFVFNHPHSPVAEAVRSIRTNILFMSPDKKMKTMAVTSAAPLEGKTTIATYLAISIAMSGEKTLLVDADMRKPRVHKVFSLNPKVGFSTLIVNKSNYEEVIVETKVPNLSILPCGPIPPNPAELQQSEHFNTVFEGLGNRFDRIIFDSPPIGLVADPAIIGQKVDGVVVITKYGSTSRAMLKNASSILSKVKVNIIGGIMNYVDMKKWGNRQYYYSKDGYSSKYGYSTSEVYGSYKEEDSEKTAPKSSDKKGKKGKTKKNSKS